MRMAKDESANAKKTWPIFSGWWKPVRSLKNACPIQSKFKYATEGILPKQTHDKVSVAFPDRRLVLIVVMM